MLKNNVEADAKVKCIEENVSQVQLAYVKRDGIKTTDTGKNE